jgi:DNA-directed RNA polymerase sigma subunit (sigma70/sigma32)
MTHAAHVEYDGYNWIAELDSHPGAVTQAKRLDQLPERLVEVVRLVTGKKVTPGDIELDYSHADVDAAVELRELRADLADIEQTLASKTPRVVKALRRQGYTVRDIGTLVGVSHQRVQQLLTSRPPRK